MSQQDIQEITAFCGVDNTTAEHYLSLFGDKNRAIRAHCDNASDPMWFAHPAKTETTDVILPPTDDEDNSEDWKCDECSQTNDPGYPFCGGCQAPQPQQPAAPFSVRDRISKANKSVSNKAKPFVNRSSTPQPYKPTLSSSRQRQTSSNTHIPETKSDTDTEEQMDDRTFYAAFNHIVDTFCDQVYEGQDLTTLRATIQDADNYLNRQLQSGLTVPRRSDLANRICYRDVSDQGRTP